MRYLITMLLFVVSLSVGCGRDDTPPPEVNLETQEIEIDMGELVLPGDDGDDGDLLELSID